MLFDKVWIIFFKAYSCHRVENGFYGIHESDEALDNQTRGDGDHGVNENSQDDLNK